MQMGSYIQSFRLLFSSYLSNSLSCGLFHISSEKHSLIFFFQLLHQEKISCVCRSKEEVGEASCALAQVRNLYSPSVLLQMFGLSDDRVVDHRLAGSLQPKCCGNFKG